MPTNLPPEYFAVEREYKEAKDPKEKARLLEELISTIPKHKGTDKLRASLRQKLSKLKTSAQSKKGTGKQDSHFHIEKEGDGRIVIAGCANVGKSSLVHFVTHAKPEVSDYPFSTWIPTPGMMDCDNIQLQLVDTPPLNREYIEPEFFDLARSADLILVMIDLQDFPFKQLDETLLILQEHKIIPLSMAQGDEGVRVSKIPFLIAVNKVDDENKDEDYNALCELMELNLSCLPISVKTNRKIDDLKHAIVKKLDIIRIYSKPPGKPPMMDKPFVIKSGGTVEDFAMKVHHDFFDKLRTAKVWGKGVHDGQLVGRDHVLYDGDIVELNI